MPADAEPIERLLIRAEEAHGRYEATELGGEYDRDWARWYAAYAVDQGIGEILGRHVTVDELAEFLATRFGEFERADPKPTESWAAYIARRMATEL